MDPIDVVRNFENGGAIPLQIAPHLIYNFWNWTPVGDLEELTVVNYLYCCTVHLVDSLIITLPTNALIVCHLLILNHLFKTIFTAPTCFDSISLIIIREHIEFLAKSRVKNMNFFRYNIVVHLPPCTINNAQKCRICCHNNIITKKVHIFNTWF